MNILYINSTIYDYLTATLIQGLVNLGHTVNCTENSNYGTVIDADFKTYAETADLIIVGSNLGVKLELMDQISNPRVVYVDGSDFGELWIPGNIKFKAVFKRELCKALQSAAEDHVYPLPFAAEDRYFSKLLPKKYVASFVANMGTNPMRNSIHVRMKNYNSPLIISGATGERAYNGRNASFISTPNYHEILAVSLMSVNVPGAGYDCARFWEILASGTMVLTFKPDIVIPDDFTDGVDYATFDSLQDFDDKFAYYIRHQEEALKIAQNGYRHVCEHHTTLKRAQFFMEHAMGAVSREGFCQQFYRP